MARWQHLILAPVLAGVLALGGCDEETRVGVESVEIDGRTFYLELAADGPSREKGLGGREFIEPDGGMLFVFPNALPRNFVMRDCLVPIDIVFLDPAGRVVRSHAMEPEPLEPPQAEGESDAAYRARRTAYEARLKKYGSGFAAQFVIELAGGTLESLDVDPGDRIELDVDRLKRLAE